MNYCKSCGAPAPEDKDLCWICEHTPKLSRPQEAFESRDINVPAEEECEMCKIPTPDKGGT